MQQLHPYWRMQYIEVPRLPTVEKPFTALPALGDDRTALIVYRSQLSYLILNRYPYNPGHLLAVPFREVSEIENLTEEESTDLIKLMIFGKKILRLAMKPDGFNMGFNLGHAVSGGSIAHLHGHIVPRWQGDTNFMPVIGETRILPQALETTWEKLVKTVADCREGKNA